MRRIVAFTALSLAVAALHGTAVGVPGGEDDQVQLAPSVERLEILRCIGFEQLRVALHNTTADHQYGDVFLEPTGPVTVSRAQWSTYTPVGADIAMPSGPITMTRGSSASPEVSGLCSVIPFTLRSQHNLAGVFAGLHHPVRLTGPIQRECGVYDGPHPAFRDQRPHVLDD